jgi:hypothetical protein
MKQIDHQAVRLAVLGVRDSLERLSRLVDNSPVDLDSAGIFAVNATNWACALDEVFRETDQGYEGRRDADLDGRFLDGLRYVRDRHMHQLVVSSTPIWRVTAIMGLPAEQQPPNEPGIAWRPVVDIAEPDHNRTSKPYYVRRRTAYEDLLQLRRVHIALSASLRWLSGEAEARQVGLPTWQLPVFRD